MPIIPNNTLSSIVDLIRRANPIIKNPPLSHRETPFTLDSSGIAGFFGGESAVRATATVNLVTHRRWFGWYNAPGSYEVARQYSGLANVRLFEALFPSTGSSPAKILMVDGQLGPEYTPLYSTTNTVPSSIEHLGSLMARTVSLMSGRKDSMEAHRVMFVKLNHIPPHELSKLDLVSSSSVTIFGIITILVSIGGCIGCILVADWFCLASIAIGIIANGVACMAIGSGKLYLKHNPPARLQAAGDVLLRTDRDIIVLIGNEGSVSPFTRGRFELHFGDFITTRPTAAAIPHAQRPAALFRFIPTFSQSRIHKYLLDISVILLLSQFLTQLLLIPQGTLFGQLMFVGTLVASWMYNSYLSSISLKLQTTMLFKKLRVEERPDTYTCELKSWTEAVVFACLLFRAIHLLPAEVLQENYPEWMNALDNDRVTMRDNRAQEAEEAEEAAEAAEAAERALATGAQAQAQAAAATARQARSRAEQKRADANFVDATIKEERAKRAKMEERAKKAYNSFQRLLDALLPRQTGALKAFKESLVRKISKTEVDPYAADRPPPFSFSYLDSCFEVADGQERITNEEIVTQLRRYQDDARAAFDKWTDEFARVPPNNITIAQLRYTHD